MQYQVNVSSVPQQGKPGGNANFSLAVEADHVLDALDRAKVALAATIEASGLTVKPAAS